MSDLLNGLRRAEQYFLEMARGSMEGEDYALAEVCNRAVERIQALEARLEWKDEALTEIANSGVRVHTGFNWIATMAEQALGMSDNKTGWHKLTYHERGERIAKLEATVRMLGNAHHDEIETRTRNTELEAEIDELKAQNELLMADLQSLRAGHTVTVAYNLSPLMKETALRNKLIDMGWTPPQGEQR